MAHLINTNGISQDIGINYFEWVIIIRSGSTKVSIIGRYPSAIYLVGLSLVVLSA